ncbi:MAG TPA: hypothetical protein VM600_00440, partial [Actinomycetota bacterium]|nr:hypothetical protein [Actinomycetota bacterium]
MKRAGAVAVLGVACLVLSLGGASQAADRVPNADEWRHAAATGTPVDIYAGGRHLRLQVRVNGQLAATPVVGLDGARPERAVPLEATIAGDDDGWARITVQGNAVTGFVKSSRAGEITLAPARDGTTRALTRADVATLIRKTGIDTVIEPDGGLEAAQSCDSLGWTPEFAPPTELVTGSPARVFDVAFAVDETFVNAHPANWSGLALGFVNTMDGLFRASFALRINAVHLIAIPNSVISATTTTQQLVQLQDYYV